VGPVAGIDDPGPAGINDAGYNRRGESRLQRCRFGLLRILARRARFATANPSCGGHELNAAPLALNTNLDVSLRVKARASSS